MNVLSLFDGMSCGMIALKRAGINVSNYYASEIDKHAIKVSEANYPDIIKLGDVQHINYQILPKIDLLIAGSPCQGFSFAGKQLNFNDPRSSLFFEFVSALKQLKKRNQDIKFLLENVNMKKEYLDVITGLLGVEPIKINSALVSAQNRVRWYWTNIDGVQQPEDKGILLKDIVLQDVTDMDLSDKALDYMNRSVSGGRNHWDFKHHSDASNDKSSAVVANFFKGVPYNVLIYQLHHGANKGGARALNGKAPSVTSSCWEHNNFIINNSCAVRKFLPMECEMLQTIRPGYTKHVSPTQRYKMIGNGWTIDVIAHIFKGLQLPC